MKRIIFLSCHCTSKTVENNYDDEDMNDDVITNEPETSPSLFYSINSDSSPKKNASQPVSTMIG